MRTTQLVAGVCLWSFACVPAFGAEGIYVGFEAGASSVADWEHTRTKWTPCGPEVTDARVSFDEGLAAFGAFGYAFRNWRFELEGGYRQNDVGTYTKIYRRGSHSFDPDGELTEASLMANIAYDIRLFERFSLSIGAGAGGDYTMLKLDTHFPPVDEGDFHFAYQGLAGLNYAITNATAVFVSYRFARVTDIGFDPTDHIRLEGDDLEKQSATAGVRFALFSPEASPKPAPVATPAPAPAPPPVAIEREFMVFFAFNQASLTDEALATIKQVIDAVRSSGSAAIRVVGHADRAGSIAYNRVLSLRRAKSVKKALIAEGIDGKVIQISGRGEKEPLVPTADGVREAQNRRVHISF